MSTKTSGVAVSHGGAFVSRRATHAGVSSGVARSLIGTRQATPMHAMRATTCRGWAARHLTPLSSRLT
jgi:hypothetical protein